MNIGRYEVIKLLGKGGMASVYRAHDPTFGRDVAIKLMPREFLHDDTFRERFQREAKTIAGLGHSAIVPVYDFGDDEGQPYLVMALMEGGSLADRLREQVLDPAEALKIIERIAAALDAAHKKSIIHRDVKPANILLDSYGDAFLSDFGIVRLMESAAHLTGSGIVGTPTYMAPEMSQIDELTPLVDVYALGVTLFHLLTGRAPYEAQTPMGVLMAHMNHPIPDIQQVRPDLPKSVQAVIERAMAKAPADRYASAGELAYSFRAALQSVSTPRATTKGRSVSMSTAPATGPKLTRKPKPSGEHKTPKAAESVVRRGRFNPMWWVISGVALVAVIGIGLAASGMFSQSTGAPEATPFSPALTGADCKSAGLAESACTGVNSNSDWAVYTQEFNEVQMALVPAGCFTMGSEDGASDEQPVHRVCFDAPFWIDVTEVTNKQYGSSGNWSGDDLPREGVTWNDANTHCQIRGARLPTEAEWEYAARGPDGLVYPWGNIFAPDNVVYKGNIGWTIEGSGPFTAPVGSRPGGASWVGALDLSGNVLEWVNDWYAEDYFSTLADGAINPMGPDSGTYRVIRGGSWFSRSSRDLRAADRGGNNPYFWVSYLIGFRCARSY